MHRQNQIVLDLQACGTPATRAEFSYHMTPATISITGEGRLSVGKDLEAVLRKIEYWHQAPITRFKIMVRHGQGAWHRIQWDGKTATAFRLNEKDEKKAWALIGSMSTVNATK
ncbi:MAG: hypothetical protein JO279_13490 [Verrucomicrobia bacterium]|nr:hypothetical protein [Verrucomicrobiota bacterium]